jgi:hypothetical protein
LEEARQQKRLDRASSFSFLPQAEPSGQVRLTADLQPAVSEDSPGQTGWPVAHPAVDFPDQARLWLRKGNLGIQAKRRENTGSKF